MPDESTATIESKVQTDQARFGPASSMRESSLPRRQPAPFNFQDRQLAMRVASGAATTDERALYQEQRAERSRERMQMRAERSRGYAEVEPQERKSRLDQLNREFEMISDQMRSISDSLPLWHELREQKLDIFFEIEDLKAAENIAAFNERQTYLQERTDTRKQLDVAKNAPFNREPAPLISEGNANDLPGADDPGKDVQDPTIDSREVLRQQLATPHNVKYQSSAEQAVQRQ